MLNNPDAEAMIQDARAAQAAAERLLTAGDWRDAAEKAWLAARNATAAAVLEVTGAHNPNGAGITEGINKLARERGGEWARLKQDYGRVIRFLHGQAFYKGIYSEDVEARVRGAADYIRRAEQLAGE